MEATGIDPVVQGKMAQNSHTDLVFWLTAGDCRFLAKRARRQKARRRRSCPLIRFAAPGLLLARGGQDGSRGAWEKCS
jgi:hypothetical protein